jgi:outer membrane immunogenic protein
LGHTRIALSSTAGVLACRYDAFDLQKKNGFPGVASDGDYSMKLLSVIAGMILASVAALSSANAADMYQAPAGGYKDGPVAAYVSWTGFYAGANIGGAWGSDHGTVNDTNPLDTTAPFNLDSSGVFGGGQLGYNFQRGNIVFGIEADLGGMDLNASALNSKIVNVIPFRTSTSGGFYGDVTGRLGYSFGSALLYAKGGFAFLEGDAKVHVTDNPNIPETSASRFTGWTAGGGVEYALTPAWSVKAEYLHFDFGSERSATNINVECCSYDHHLTVETVKAGVNYHFVSGYEPLK